MMSDFRGDGGSEMTPKKRTLEGKNRTLGQGLLNLDGRNCQKYLHQTKADFLTLIMLYKLTQSL